MEKSVLREYLQRRREEVSTIMLTIMDQEAATRAMIANERKEAKIQTAVEMCQDFGKSVSEAVALLMRKFSLTESDSKSLVNQYWKD